MRRLHVIVLPGLAFLALLLVAALINGCGSKAVPPNVPAQTQQNDVAQAPTPGATEPDAGGGSEGDTRPVVRSRHVIIAKTPPVPVGAPMAPSTTPMAENRGPTSAEPTPAETAEQAFSKLKNNGNLAYFTPDKMKTGSNAVITARIAFADVASSSLTSGIDSGQSGSTHVEATPVTSTMKMKLSSADFTITPWSSEEQAVGGPVATEWKWQVAPLHSGTLRLHLAAVVVVGNLSRDFTTVDRIITVKVDPIDAAESFFNQHAQWILGGVLTGIGALFSWWWKRRK